MRCLTNEQTQQLIDGELSANELQQYKLHIEACPYCAEKFSEQKRLVLRIEDLLNEAAILPERIPDFKIPTKIKRQGIKNRRIPLWAKVAALLIPACFVWKMTDKPNQKEFKPTAESIQMYEMCNDVDANTAFQKNMIVTTVTDENGNVLECSTN